MSVSDDLWILVLAAVFGFLWYVSSPILVTYDTLTYLETASSINSGTANPASQYFRLPLYPVILRIFDVTGRNSSVVDLLAFQAALGVLMSWLLYRSVRPLDRRGAFWLSIVFVATCLPFLHSMAVMTEQVFLFGLICLVFCCVTYFTASRWTTACFAAIGVGLCLAALALTRPQGAYVPVVVLPLLMVLSWRRAWALIPGVAAMFIVFWAGGQIMASTFPPGTGVGRAKTLLTAADQSRTSGKMLFFTTYFASFHTGNMRIEPENGKATRTIRDNALAEFTEHRDTIELEPETRARFRTSPASLVTDIFANPTPEYFYFLWHTLDQRFGPAMADRVMLLSALEAIRAKPLDAAQFFLVRAFYVYLRPWEQAVTKHPRFPEKYFGDTLTAELNASGRADLVSPFENYLDACLRTVMILAVLAVVGTAFLAIKSPFWKIWIVLLVLATYLNGAVILGNHPVFRYAFYAIPLHMVCALIGVNALLSRRSRALPAL